jgi:hypothetical protein
MIHQTIFAATAKTTPVSADVLALVDSADNNKLKKVTFSNLTTTLTGSFLPLTGGTLTGSLTLESTSNITHTIESDALPQIIITRRSANADSGSITMRKSRGTIAAPADVVQNDDTGRFIFSARIAGANRSVMQITNTLTHATPTSTTRDNKLRVESVATGSTSFTDLFAIGHESGMEFRGSVIWDVNRHLRLRQYAAASLPTADSGDMIASSDLIAAPLVSDGTEWLSPGVLRKYAVTANTTISVPAGWALEAIHIENTTANAVTGGIRIGTTAGGTEFVTAWAVAGNDKLTSPGPTLSGFNTNFNFFSRTVAQTLFIEAVTAWNSASLQMSFVMRKVF